MGLVTADRVKEDWTGVGTGAIVLGGAAQGGFQRFGAKLVNGDTCYYTVEEPSANRWESGLATYNSGPNSLTRSAGNVFDGSAGPGALVNFGSGAKVVFLTPAAYTYPTAAQGAALPAAPFRGMRFLWVTTGRAWEMVYDGSAWRALNAFGDTEVYVNPASGTDSPEKGTGPGANAYRTGQYAVDQLPGGLAGNVLIRPSGTLREHIVIRGKTLLGNYNITIQGEDITVAVSGAAGAVSGSNPAGNGDAGYGTLTDAGAAWTVNAWRNKHVEILSGTGAGQIRPIHSNTATQLVIAGRWDTVPDGTSDFRIYDAATRITGANAGAETTPVRAHAVEVNGGQRGVILRRLKLDYTTESHAYCGPLSEMNVQECRVEGGSVYGVHYTTGAAGAVNGNVFVSCVIGLAADNTANVFAFFNNRCTSCTGAHVFATSGGSVYLRQSYLGQSAAYGLQVDNQGRAFLDGYTSIDGSAGDNVFVGDNGSVKAVNDSAAYATIVSKNSGAWGWFCTVGGVGPNASLITYSGNTSGTRTPATAPDAGTT